MTGRILTPPTQPEIPPLGPTASASAHPTFRAVACGLLGVLLLCVITPYTDLALRGSWIAHNCLPIGVLSFFLLGVTVGNRLLRRCSARWALTRGELLLVYVMMLTVAGIPSVGLAQCVIGLIIAPAYYANGSNQWATLLLPLVPDWLRVTDPAAISAFYNGAPPGTAVPWALWIRPLAAWMLHATLLYGAFFFLVALLRRPWIDHERLTFALVQVPLEIVGRDGRPTGNAAFFRNPYAWAGLAVPVLIHSLNALHNFYPSLPPAMPMTIPIGEGLVDRPWSILRNTRIVIHFSAIGLSYLLAGDVSLSLWVFWALAKAQWVALNALGYEDTGGTMLAGFGPRWWLSNQMWGALLAYGVFLLWDGYRTARRDWRRRPRAERERDIAPTAALAGFAACVLLLTLWNLAAGGRVVVQLGGLLFWIMTMLAMTRLVCAGGLILIDTNWVPRDVIYRVLGRGVVPPSDLAVLTFHNTVFAYYPQLNMLPFLFNGMKIMDEERYRDRAVGGVMALAILVAIPVSFVVTLALAYHRGALTLVEFRLGGEGRELLNELAGYLQTPLDPQWHTLFSLAFGGAAMLGMVVLKRSVDWWPLSPLGYLVGASSTVMDRLWFSAFTGWALNALVRRYGGLPIYTRCRPFFLGLILGEFGVAALWMAIDAAAGITDHRVFP